MPGCHGRSSGSSEGSKPGSTEGTAQLLRPLKEGSKWQQHLHKSSPQGCCTLQVRSASASIHMRRGSNTGSAQGWPGFRISLAEKGAGALLDSQCGSCV